jgi:hypothetical protein
MIKYYQIKTTVTKKTKKKNRFTQYQIFLVNYIKYTMVVAT